MPAAIETFQLTKYYGKVKGIDNVNFEVQEGEIFGFIGPNGAGKSTLIRTLVTLLFPTSGRASIFGLDVQQEPKKMKRLIGYVPSEVHYYDNMSGDELLRYSASFYGVKVEQEFYQLANEFDLNLKRDISDLSMGNKKKVALLQCLLHRPRLLILDEPTTGLDPKMQGQFFELLQRLNGKGTTIFFSSHVLSEVQRLCGRVAIIRNGEVETVQTVEALNTQRLKRCRLETEQPLPEGFFRLAGIENAERKNGHSSFTYSGEFNSLLAMLQPYKIIDITIEDPPLEEVFMHYYNE
ncbi:MAG: ABC transporter ATP-binding protein [Bacteroidia bacterium]